MNPSLPIAKTGSTPPNGIPAGPRPPRPASARPPAPRPPGAAARPCRVLRQRFPIAHRGRHRRERPAPKARAPSAAWVWRSSHPDTPRSWAAARRLPQCSSGSPSSTAARGRYRSRRRGRRCRRRTPAT
ncbi:MAG: hypothetical protein DMF85_05620 [Acidobacteria bacterium]|nr:MAG: hypothetical protein DMF85_05620 [Acidobacteriota bacterium]